MIERKDIVTFLHINNKTCVRTAFVFYYFPSKKVLHYIFSAPVINLEPSYHTRLYISTVWPNGYVQTTMQEIAEACKISKSSVYQQFSSKEALLVERERHPSPRERLERSPELADLLAGLEAACRQAGLVRG